MQRKSSKNIGPTQNGSETSEIAGNTTSNQSDLFAEVTHALYEVERKEIEKRRVPTCPDISLPWSEAAGQNGWSAKMFLHQMMCFLKPHWKFLDTERLLSGQIPRYIQDKTNSAILLSAVLKKPGQADLSSYISERAVKGLLKRAKIRRTPILVLLRNDVDTMRVMVTFGTAGELCVSQIVRKGQHSLVSLVDGLKDYLIRVWQS